MIIQLRRLKAGRMAILQLIALYRASGRGDVRRHYAALEKLSSLIDQVEAEELDLAVRTHPSPRPEFGSEAAATDGPDADTDA